MLGGKSSSRTWNLEVITGNSLLGTCCQEFNMETFHREVIIYNSLWGSHCRELVFASLFFETLWLEHAIKNLLGRELIGHWLAYSSSKFWGWPSNIKLWISKAACSLQDRVRQAGGLELKTNGATLKATKAWLTTDVPILYCKLKSL